MAKLARDVMTPDPACCSPHTTLDEVAKMMAANDCGEIPVIGTTDQVIGVVTDRDIVCRVVAEGKNPMAYTAETCMSKPVLTVRDDSPLDEVVAAMEKHQVRRVPVVDERESCVGIISQADVSLRGNTAEAGQLVHDVSRKSDHEARYGGS
jgi:CBS domain-containing protein